ncbi:MAG: hypothetical protein IPL27_28270 [Lewinellaceae bacterium]|nr:hypothetical protein [Lewinellaceae bacterium]
MLNLESLPSGIYWLQAVFANARTAIRHLIKTKAVEDIFLIIFHIFRQLFAFHAGIATFDALKNI